MLLLAYATLYIVWGSTYLAIRIAVQSWTPLMLAAVRFLIAGAASTPSCARAARRRPRRASWGATAIVGGMLLAGGNGTVCWAEQWVPSGETALILAQSALWMVLLPWFLRRAPRPRASVLAGVAVGLAGVAILVAAARGGTGAGAHNVMVGRLALMLASLSWVVGSLWSRALPLPRSVALASAMQMLTASPLLFLLAGLHGDFATFHPTAIPAAGWGALAYLIVFGSLAGFGSYVFLLVHEGPARTSTNAFVNPLIAVALVHARRRALGPRTFVAAGMIVAAVAGVILGTAKR